jgi:uncharacterized protein YegL
MKNDLTYIAMLLDRSGSMHGSEADVIGGVNKFIEEQKSIVGKTALLTIAQFDDSYDTIMEDVAIDQARNLTTKDFVPRGNTGLADAMGRLITHVGARLEAMSEEDRPGQVFILIFSDGGENCSRETNLEAVRARVKHQETVYSWKFLYFGMDIDASAVGGSIGAASMRATKGGGGLSRGYGAASAYVGNSRLGNHTMAASMLGAKSVDDKDVKFATESFQKDLEDQKDRN